MKIAITSGKGGVGKTFAATCLATVMAESQSIRYIDCDVEAPNAHLFLNPDNISSKEQTIPCIEKVDPEKCIYCGICVKVCYFNAIVVGKKNAMVFPELCRWCGACQIACPQDALVVNKRTIGTVYQGQVGKIDLHWATLQAGAGGMTVRLIERIKENLDDTLTILDSPPGTSCAVVSTIQDADVVILVADPTRFGQHDLKLSVHLCRSMNIDPLVLVNRSGIGNLRELHQWCAAENLPILAEIPDDRTIAEYYSKGQLPAEHLDYLRQLFSLTARKLASLPQKRINKKTTGDTKPNPETFFLDSNPLLKTNDKQTPTSDLTEITVVSGKGGTGKTSLAACFTQLEKATVADCDVDAADMHLLFKPQVLESGEFIGGQVMSINPRKCSVCEKCIDVCQWNAISKTGNTVAIDESKCEGCGACLLVCLTKAIKTTQTHDGKWYWSSTRYTNMSHATLEPGKENSGKLVTLVRKNAACKKEPDNPVVILDGSPGTGCPVIASVGGAKAAVIVTEPTVSGLHDLNRILELTEHFKIPAGVIINKADINPQVTEDIKKVADKYNAGILGHLPYDPAFIDAQQEGKTVLEYQPNSDVSKEIQIIWNKVRKELKQ